LPVNAVCPVWTTVPVPDANTRLGSAFEIEKKKPASKSPRTGVGLPVLVIVTHIEPEATLQPVLPAEVNVSVPDTVFPVAFKPLAENVTDPPIAAGIRSRDMQETHFSLDTVAGEEDFRIISIVPQAVTHAHSVTSWILAQVCLMGF